MKVMTILGTRPEIIRLSRIIPQLDRLCDHVLVHTGQNYDPTLKDIFFEGLCLRRPDFLLNCRHKSLMGQIGSILAQCEKVMLAEKPDRLLILGDTNSALSALAAKRLGIPVYHMEAGNRCFDDRVPEEINRRVVDHCSDILMPYTERSRDNLLQEGIAGHNIYVTGNPIWEVLTYYSSKVENSQVIQQLSLEPKKYFLVTLHRAENVDIEERLINFIDAFHLLHSEFNIPVICSLHPRTVSKLKKYKRTMAGEGIRILKPLGLFDFVYLEKNAACVLSDSGTVQEECCIFKVPNVTLRDVTERPETIEKGSNILSGCQPESILNTVKVVRNQMCDWVPPWEYTVHNVSNTVVKIILGKN